MSEVNTTLSWKLTNFASAELKGLFDTQIRSMFSKINDQLEALHAERPSEQLVESLPPNLGRELISLEIYRLVRWSGVVKIRPEAVES